MAMYSSEICPQLNVSKPCGARQGAPHQIEVKFLSAASAPDIFIAEVQVLEIKDSQSLIQSICMLQLFLHKTYRDLEERELERCVWLIQIRDPRQTRLGPCNAMMLTSRHQDSDFVSPDIDGIM